MADLSDVQNALVDLLAQTVFGVGNSYVPGSAAVSLLGPQVRIYPAWPLPSPLDNDLRAGQGSTNLADYIVNVSVFTEGQARLTTRYQYQWDVQSWPAPTLLVSQSGQSVTFSGTTATSNIAGIALNNYAPVAYRCIAGDTPSTVAANLAAQLNWASPTVSGATITFPSFFTNIAARTGADAVGYTESRRQEQVFRITVWAPNPNLRTLIGAAIDNQMAYTRSLNLPDGTCTNIPKCRGTILDDVVQTKHEWRRDFRYAIEYPTIYTQTQTPVLFPYAQYDLAPTLEQIQSGSFISEDGTVTFTFVNGTPVETTSGPNY